MDMRPAVAFNPAIMGSLHQIAAATDRVEHSRSRHLLLRDGGLRPTEVVNAVCLPELLNDSAIKRQHLGKRQGSLLHSQLEH